MTYTFDSKVSLHSWLLWPTVRRGGRSGPTEAGAAASEAAEVRAGAACFLSILRP